MVSGPISITPKSNSKSAFQTRPQFHQIKLEIGISHLDHVQLQVGYVMDNQYRFRYLFDKAM